MARDILLVVDDDDLLAVLRDCLDGAGYTLYVANTQESVLQAWRKLTPPALLLLDWDHATLQPMVLLSSLRQLRPLDHPSLGVVVLAPSQGRPTVMGVDEVVLKPIDGPLFLEVIQRQFERL